MPDLICNTSPLQYLHQLGLLHILPRLGTAVIVPNAVVAELAVGRIQGVDLPDVRRLSWVTVVQTKRRGDALPGAAELGAGEMAVLHLAVDLSGAVAVLDDGLARQVARLVGLRFTGTLGLLCDAKRLGLVSEVRPLLDRLEALRFRVSPSTREAVLRLAGEPDDRRVPNSRA